MASFVGYEVVLQNALPFWDRIRENVESISTNNQITICDFDNIAETRESGIIDKYFTNGKYKRLTYVYEAFGYKKMNYPKLIKLKKVIHVLSVKEKKSLQKIISMMAYLN